MEGYLEIFGRNFCGKKGNFGLWRTAGEIAGARDILQKFENLKKQHELNFNL
jgi:hypothetical protein